MQTRRAGRVVFRQPRDARDALVPSLNLLQWLLPIFDVINHDLRRLVCCEVAPNSFNEIALWVYLLSVIVYNQS
jgi:hypothetical protein